MTWLIVQAAYATTDVALDHLTKVEGERNVRARRMRTQVMLLRRTCTAVAVVIATAAALFTFPSVRVVGAGLLASAGVAGIVAGIAAQSTLSNVFAGLQPAFDNALRIDDVVVQGQWGRIEELTLTYPGTPAGDRRGAAVRRLGRPGQRAAHRAVPLPAGASTIGPEGLGATGHRRAAGRPDSAAR